MPESMNWWVHVMYHFQCEYVLFCTSLPVFFGKDSQDTCYDVCFDLLLLPVPLQEWFTILGISFQDVQERSLQFVCQEIQNFSASVCSSCCFPVYSEVGEMGAASFSDCDTGPCNFTGCRAAAHLLCSSLPSRVLSALLQAPCILRPMFCTLSSLDLLVLEAVP